MIGMFKNDTHCHTNYSPCGKEDAFPLFMLEKAATCGLKTLAFTDHYADHPPHGNPDFVNCGYGMVEAIREEINGQETGVRVLFGCEADVLKPGDISISPLNAAKLDFVMVSASHFHLFSEEKRKAMSPREKAESFLEFLDYAVQIGFVNVIAHPFWTPCENMGKSHLYLKEIRDEEFRVIAEKAVANRVAMEVNSILGYNDSYRIGMKQFFQIYLAVGGKLTYGGDSHSVDRVGYTEPMVPVLRYLDLSPTDFLQPDQLIYKDWN
ncbi:MAG: PHP domain-containing protein [Anaerolineales bacterium]|nr:PHP domain-containing protein [Anaerolineales bacterium]